MAMEWEGKVAAAGLTCAISNLPLAPSTTILSALRLAEGRFIRDDVSESHWANYDRTGVISWWRHTVPPAQSGPNVLRLDTLTLLRLYHDLGSRDDRPSQIFRYLVGLCLVRQRQLHLERFVKRSDGEFLICRERKTRMVSEFFDPKATPEELVLARDDMLRAAGIAV